MKKVRNIKLNVLLKRDSSWSSHATGRKTVTELYDQLVRKGIISFDKSQRAMTESCDPLVSLINRSKEVPSLPPIHFSPSTNRLRIVNRIYFCHLIRHFLSKGMRKLVSNTPSRSLEIPHPVFVGAPEKRGLYIWGSVGIGKTMILDLFDMCDLPLPKRRSHLHSFITDISNRLVKAELDLRQRRLAAQTPSERGLVAPVSPMDLVVDDVLRESPILCFDEFQTFDVAHAAILASFFKNAFAKGIFFITTSNRPPEDICTVSSSFTQFLPILKSYCYVVHAENIRDYRYKPTKEHYHANIFLYPNTKENAERMLRRLNRGIKTAQGGSEWMEGYSLWHHGRCMVIPYYLNGVAVFDFQDICGGRQGLSPVDFELLAHLTHTVFIANVPKISSANRNAAHQFIILVDELYQHNVKLLFTSEVPWYELLESEEYGTKANILGASTDYYSEGEDERSGCAAVYNFQNEEESISFTRIKSRLHEMGCMSYLLRQHERFVVSDFDFNSLIENI
ncbi:unnamed protein product [Phytomonas sp. Hart1]|nr:unnamed protein product [Phytomonas sp. Hart1]|eukprot:CCW70095.1 unnamed protein product [Phytomonas sp. isolate Hart1]